MENNILKTALIGVGNMGRKYAEMITAGEVPIKKSWRRLLSGEMSLWSGVSRL